MKELQRRQRMRKIIYSWAALLVLAVMSFFLVKGAFEVMTKERESAAQVNKLEEESLRINSREAELREEIARLQTEEGVIEEIRDKFSVTQEGEYMAIIVDDRRTTSTDRAALSWYEKLWNAIIGK